MEPLTFFLELLDGLEFENVGVDMECSCCLVSWLKRSSDFGDSALTAAGAIGRGFLFSLCKDFRSTDSSHRVGSGIILGGNSLSSDDVEGLYMSSFKGLEASRSEPEVHGGFGQSDAMVAG